MGCDEVRFIAAVVDDVRVADRLWLTTRCGSLDDAHPALEQPTGCGIARGAVPGPAFVVAPGDLREGRGRVDGRAWPGARAGNYAYRREPDAAGLAVDVHPWDIRACPRLESRGSQCQVAPSSCEIVIAGGPPPPGNVKLPAPLLSGEETTVPFGVMPTVAVSIVVSLTAAQGIGRFPWCDVEAGAP